MTLHNLSRLSENGRIIYLYEKYGNNNNIMWKAIILLPLIALLAGCAGYQQGPVGLSFGLTEVITPSGRPVVGIGVGVNTVLVPDNSLE